MPALSDTVLPALAEPAPLFAALGDATRLRLVARLGVAGPLSIARLTVGMDVTRQAVTKHLHVLQAAGLVRGHRRGREQVWEVAPAQIAEAKRYLDLLSRDWDVRLERLRVSVEGD